MCQGTSIKVTQKKFDGSETFIYIIRVMNTTTTIKFNEEVCSLTTSRTVEPFGSRQKHTILYISNPFDPEELKYSGITKRPEYSHKGEDKELDKEWKRYNKAELAIQKRIIYQAVQGGLIDEGLAQGLKFSRKAGCQCGCSPGWKARDYRRQSIWLKVTSPSKEQEKKERDKDYAAVQEAKTLASMVI